MGEFHDDGNNNEAEEPINFLMEKFQREILPLMKIRLIKFHGIEVNELEQALIDSFGATEKDPRDHKLIEEIGGGVWEDRMTSMMFHFIEWLTDERKINRDEALLYSTQIWGTVADKFKPEGLIS